ncbi:hypothetical protein C8A05DRAFT_18017 [Staphylotrichum tortipilum]|uniref:Uncharacterized protein n=1 Tax=Staphylotrichum tortipilum TaxID=2831512 RepID=A0AAN6MGA7_9PEZI|nr:hypothetical protein C8A05DRAFT_18017 [Staphylotrichum longicolle]
MSVAEGAGRVYAYETPALAPGAYSIDVRQTVSSPGQPDQQLTSSRPFHVKATDPYVLPPGLVHSFFPPRMRTVTATTLPHITLAGAVPWERPLSDVKRADGSAPYPWLALLVFTPDELMVPLSVTGSRTKPSATKTLSLTLDAVNSNMAGFCMKEKFPKDQASTDTANFIFVKGNTFRSYFERQEPAAEQVAPDLDRYRFLTYITDTGQITASDGNTETPIAPGQPTNKYSTIMGHRSRPFTGNIDGPQPVLAHLVSLEGLTSRVNWLATGEQNAIVALASLHSWTYTWEPNSANQSLQLFEGLKGNVGPLSIALPDPTPEEKPDGARAWMRGRLEEGYTIIRHRDLAGESTMALYRGPLCPRQARRVQIRPTMYGTDLQIIDMSAKILDVSYSVAWDLGRSLAGRDAKFSTALAALRRQLVIKAIVGARAGSGVSNAIAVDLVERVLGSLDTLFTNSEDGKLKGFPEDGNKRWQGTSGPSEAHGAFRGSGVMTQAKLRRNLVTCTRPWVLNAVAQLCKIPEEKKTEAEGSGQPPPPPAPIPCDIPVLPEVISWILTNLLSLRLVPALYLFPDPTVFRDEFIHTFLIDDTWVDAMVDGALSVGNAVGGIDDPVRDEIRGAINAYILSNPGGKVRIPSAGFVMRSALIESFPDVEITAVREKDSSDGGGEEIPMVYRRRHDDTIICMCARGISQTLADFSVSLKLPAHQQCFVLGQPATSEELTFGIRLESLINPDAQPPPEIKPGQVEQVKWRKEGIPIVTPDDMELPREAWNWQTGIMLPHAIVDAIIKVTDKKLGTAFKRLGTDSGSVYLATQLPDRQHSLVVPFKINATTNSRTRQLFPLLEEVTETTGPTQPAKLYVPVAVGSDPSGARPSLLTKKAFSLLFPDKNIPVQSSPPQTVVFVVKPATTAPTPPPGVTIKLVSIEFIIPVGSGSDDLLDEDAADPLARTTDRRMQWVAAAYRKSEGELAVRLKPRVPGKALPLTGLDASFMLTRATVNGVLGDRVEIRFEETYVEEKKKVAPKKYTVSGGWVVAKE